MSAFPGFLDVFRRHRKSRRSMLRREPAAAPRHRLQLHREQLERRLALAIDVFQPLNAPWTVVTSDSGSDVYLQQVAGDPQNLIIADNPSFNNYRTIVDVNNATTALNVTNGTRLSTTNQPTVGLGGSTTTTFVLADGSLNTNVGQLISGSVAYRDSVWNFTNNGNGTALTFTLTTSGTESDPTLIRPVSGSVASSEAGQDNDSGFEVGGFGTLGITWTAPPDHIAGPRLTQVTYRYRFVDGLGFVGTQTRSLTNLSPSAGSGPSFQLALGTQNAGGVVPGSLSGTINVGGGSLSFRTASVDSGNVPLWFEVSNGVTNTVGLITLTGTGPAPVASRRVVTGTLNTVTGLIGVNFYTTNESQGFGGGPTTYATGVPQDLGPVTITADYAVLSQDSSPNTVTLAPGLDFTRELSVDLLTPGSTFNINSRFPQAVGTTGITVSATNVNVNAETTSNNKLIIGPRSQELTGTLITASGRAIVSAAGTISRLYVPAGAGGQGYDPNSPPAVTISGGGGSGATATALVQNGVLVGLNLINRGAGYTSLPTVTIAPPPAQLATAAAVLAGQEVTAINVLAGGRGYDNDPARAPLVTISGGGGTGALATAIVRNGVVDRVVITNLGTGYTSLPTVTIAPPPQIATAVAVLTGSEVTSIRVPVGGGGRGYDNDPANAPLVTISGGGGSGAMATAFVQNGVVVRIDVTNPGAGYTSPPTVTIAPPTAFILSTPVPERVNVNARVAATSYDVRVGDDPVTSGWTRGRLYIAPSGSFVGRPLSTPAVSAASVFIQADTADVFVEGTVDAANQTYLLRSPAGSEDRAPYFLTTASPATGVTTGLIKGTNVAVTLANDLETPDLGGAGSNVVALRTDVNSLRVTAATRGGPTAAFPYELSIDEANDLVIDAVPASSRTIAIRAGGAIALSSALATDGDLDIAAGGSFQVVAPVTTTRGQIAIEAMNLDVGNSLRVLDPAADPLVDDIVLTATGGSLSLTGPVSAVNNIRLVQRGGGGAISGPTRVIGRALKIDAAGAVDIRAAVDFLQGTAGGAFTLDELDDITISSLQAGGRVTLRANGVDPGLSNVLSPNGIALTAALQGVTSLDVSVPNGSVSVITNTDRTLSLGNPQAIAAGTATSMVAGGSVEIRSVAGPIDVTDAPLGGSGGLGVRVATAAALLPATFAYNTPGLRASTLTANAVGPLVVDGIRVSVGNRVLVKNQVNARENGVYVVTIAGSDGPPGRPWVLTRATDVDTTDELPANSIVRVNGGTSAGDVFKIDYTPTFGRSPLVATTTANRSGAARVRVATTAPLPGTYDRSGTISGTGRLPAIDGAILAVGDRVLVRLGAQAPGLPSAAANGVYEVTSDGDGGGNWLLTRGVDIDTGKRIKTGYVAVSEGTFRSATTGQGFRLGYDSLGNDPMVVSPMSGGRPVTNIGSNDFADTVTFAVSSSAGRNNAAGSLGKMIRLYQANDTSASPIPQQRTDFRFSSLINAPIVLADELPVISEPLTLDGAVASRYVAPGTAAGGQPISINGASITTRNDGTGVFRSVGTATVRGSATLFVPGTFPNFEELREGMAVQGVGIVPGSRIASINRESREVTLTVPVEAAPNASVTVTFATEVNGFQFAPGSTTTTAGSRLANLFVGGFASGSAVRITAPAVAPTFAGPPYTVTVDRVTIGESAAGGRLSNEFGVVVADTGSAHITNGTISSSEGAAIRTQDAATGVVVTGMRIGKQGFPNVTGVDVAGSGTVEIGSTAATPTASLTALRNTIAYNRAGVVLRAGTNRIVNTTISDSSFDGVQITGGNYQIGGSTTRDASSNEIVRNGDKAIEILTAADPANPQADSRRIQGNFLSITANGATAANLGGTIYASSIANTRRLGLRPRSLGVDVFGNLHGARAVRPVMYLATPLDNVDGDSDVRDDRIRVTGDAAYTTRIALGIEDGVNATSDASVAARAFVVQYSTSRNVTDWSGPGVTTWVAGTNYSFGYDSANRQVNFDVPGGFPGGSYRILVDNSATTGVRDTSGNAVLNNNVAGDGTTAFIVVLDYSADIVIGPATPAGTTLFVPGQSLGRNVQIVNDGDIVIQGVVEVLGVGRTISVTSTNGRVLFDPAGELRASSVSLSAAGNSQLRVGAGTVLASATVSAGSLELMGKGTLQQSGPITAGSLIISEIGGAVNLDNAGNAVNAFAVTAGRSGAPVTFVNSRGFTVAAGTIVTAGTGAVADGGIALQALTGDLIVDGRLAAPGDIAFLRAAGRVILGSTFTKDVQMLVIQDSLGTRLDGSFLVADSAGLASAVAFINSLPAGTAPCPVTVVASFTLDQTLTFNRPVILSAQSPALQIRGSANVTNGLIFSAGAANSRITGLSFAQFAGTALSFDGVRNLQIQGITVIGGGTGLSLIGDMTGAIVTGSRFQSVQVGMRLENLRNATIGGTAVTLRNRIEGAARAGVVATGFCTGTRIIGTTFATRPATRVQFQVGSSRGLRITGTVTAR